MRWRAYLQRDIALQAGTIEPGSRHNMDDAKRTMEFAASLIGDDGEYLYSEWELDQVASASLPFDRGGRLVGEVVEDGADAVDGEQLAREPFQ